MSDSQVDLVMFMPSGYAKANKERTEANAYATLMELETTMRDMNARVQWMDPDSVVGRGAPFDDVYFVDTANLANKATQDVKDVYQMVADTLFEDFASADFANRKRSVAVNQQQHKLGPYNPRVPEQRFGDMRLSYSKVYSAFGQAVLDTQQSLRDDIRAYELAALMVKAFFGLVARRRHRRPARRATRSATPSCASRWAWASTRSRNFPDFRKGTVDVTPFQEYALTDMLLMDKDRRSLLERVESKVQVEIDRIMASYDLKLWREKVVELLPQPGARRHPRGRRHRRDQRRPHQAPDRRTAGRAAPERCAGACTCCSTTASRAASNSCCRCWSRSNPGWPSAISPTPSATASATATSATPCARARSRNR